MVAYNGCPSSCSRCSGQVRHHHPGADRGRVAERVRFRGYFAFIAVWSVLVYSPMCHWVWATDGFLFQMGAIDFAGGTVVHASAGVSGLIAVIYLGSRRGYPGTAIHPTTWSWP